MEKLFYINILNAEKKIYQGQIRSLVVPAKLGFLGVLANHAPLVAQLVKGRIALTDSMGEKEFFYSQGPGFLEVFNNNVTILLDSAVS